MGYMAPFPRGTTVSQPFGSSPGGYNPAGGHTGKDYAVPVGTPIYAACDGIIRNSGWLTANYLANDWWLTDMGGDTTVLDGIDADGNTFTMPTFIYAHQSDSTAPVGARVKKGQIIGYSGNTGTATSGPHCHVEVLPPGWDWNNGTFGRVNPDLYFTEYPSSITAQSAESEAAIMASVFETKIQEYRGDGKTRGGIKTAAFILGNLNQWVGRILDLGQKNLAETKALRAEFAAYRKAAGK